MTRFLSIASLIVTATFVMSPLLTDPFSGFRPDQLPIPQIQPPVQPAGYAFAIWGLIYGWLVVSAVFGIWRRADDAGWDNARLPLIISLGVGTPWLAIANDSAIWATVTIFIMALTAIIALTRAPKSDKWLFAVPVAIYAGWLSVAAFVSLGTTAAGYGVLTDQVGWAYLGILGALGLATVVLLRTGAPAYGLTVVWALIGIVLANQTAFIGVTLLATAGIVIVLTLVVLTRPSGRLTPS